MTAMVSANLANDAVKCQHEALVEKSSHLTQWPLSPQGSHWVAK
jgi:hypothetical protein